MSEIKYWFLQCWIYRKIWGLLYGRTETNRKLTIIRNNMVLDTYYIQYNKGSGFKVFGRFRQQILVTDCFHWGNKKYEASHE